MKKIYLKNSKTGEIQVFESEASIGSSYISSDWKMITQDEYNNLAPSQNLRDTKKAEVKQKRDEFMYQNVSYNNEIFTNSITSQANISSVVMPDKGSGTVNLDKIVPWLTADGRPINLKVTQLIELTDKIKEIRSTGYFKERDFNNLIDGVKTIGELNSIVIEFSNS